MRNSRSKEQDKQNSQKENCGSCLSQLALAISLQSDSSFAKDKGMDSFSTAVISWECAACGQKYVTAFIVSNLQVRESPSSQTLNFARWVTIKLVLHMRTTLSAIFSSIWPSPEVPDLSKPPSMQELEKEANDA